jgi:hypothetical protein
MHSENNTYQCACEKRSQAGADASPGEVEFWGGHPGTFEALHVSAYGLLIGRRTYTRHLCTRTHQNAKMNAKGRPREIADIGTGSMSFCRNGGIRSAKHLLGLPKLLDYANDTTPANETREDGLGGNRLC